MGQDTATANAPGADASAGQARDSEAQSATDTARPSQDTVAVGDSSHIGKTGNRLEPTESSEQANDDTLANQPGSDRVRPPEDSSETIGLTNDMARDTTTQLGQADTTAPDTSTQVAVDSTSVTDTSTQVAADTAAVQVQIDTTQQVEMAQRAPADTAAIQAQTDTTAAAQPSEAAPHPAVDTAVQADTGVVASAGTTQPQARQQTEAGQTDSATVAAASASSGNMATGAEAVALMSREGRRCSVVDAEEDRDSRWDLASSPATMNPCGTGTMTLPRVQEEK
jgi:hypothetical protein